MKKMENEIKFNFLPSYNYKAKYIGFGLALLSVLYLFSYSYFDINFVDIKVVKWLIAFSLLVAAMSREKRQNQNTLNIKYYAGKFSFSYTASFILALQLANFFIDKTLEIENLSLIMIALIIYHSCFYTFKALTKGRRMELEEESVLNTISSNKALFWIAVALSLLTLLVLLV